MERQRNIPNEMGIKRSPEMESIKPELAPVIPKLKGSLRLSLAQLMLYGGTVFFATSDRSLTAFALVEGLFAGAIALTATSRSVRESK